MWFTKTSLQASEATHQLASQRWGSKHAEHVSHHGQSCGHVAMVVVPSLDAALFDSLNSQVSRSDKLLPSCKSQTRKRDQKTFKKKKQKANTTSLFHPLAQKHPHLEARHCCITTGVGAMSRSIMPWPCRSGFCIWVSTKYRGSVRQNTRFFFTYVIFFTSSVRQRFSWWLTYWSSYNWLCLLDTVNANLNQSMSSSGHSPRSGFILRSSKAQEYIIIYIYMF